MRRVVVTGMGMISPLGVGVDFSWNNLIAGKSGIDNLKFEAPYLNSQVAGSVPLGSKSEGKWSKDDYRKVRGISPFIEYALAATDQAIEDSGLSDLTEEEKERFGVVVGSGIGGLQQIYENSALLASNNYRKVSPFFIPSALINLNAGQISIKYGLKGPNLSLTTACATGTHGIIDAYNLIRSDDADIMVAGASEDPINPIGILGFDRMRALSTKHNNNPTEASRPWDKDRDGFVIAEGAGILILEELEHAKKRGAKIYAEIIGYGLSGDASHITTPLIDGSGAGRAMECAINKAKINKFEVDYINAHGTSTPLGDKAEVMAVKKVLGDHAYKVSMSSTKSATGHLLGAAGAIEAIFSILAINNNIIPPTLNLHNPDEGCDIDLVPLVAKEKKVNVAVSNSFGFGGTNGSVVFSKFS